MRTPRFSPQMREYLQDILPSQSWPVNDRLKKDHGWDNLLSNIRGGELRRGEGGRERKGGPLWSPVWGGCGPEIIRVNQARAIGNHQDPPIFHANQARGNRKGHPTPLPAPCLYYDPQASPLTPTNASPSQASHLLMRDKPWQAQGLASAISITLFIFLLVLQLLFPTIILAATSPGHIATPPDPAKKAFDRASVSVVRLIVTYGTGANAVACTGLGTLVGSWATQLGGEVTNSVLTDGSLVNSNGGTCTGKAALSLPTVQVLANNGYTAKDLTLSSLGVFPLVASDVICANPITRCASGAVLFSFKTGTQLQPYVDPAPATNIQPQEPSGITLTNGTSTVALPPIPKAGETQPQYVLDVQPFLSPMSVTPVKGQELGTPLFNSEGQITQLWLSGASAGTDVVSFLTSKLLPQKPSGLPAVLNPLKTGWDAGIDSYYASHFSDAITAFKAIALVNPNFKAATDFATTAQAAQTAQNNSATATATAQKSGSHPVPEPGTPNFDFFGIPFLAWVVGSAIILLVIVGVLIRSTIRQLGMARFREESAKAKEEADREAQEEQRWWEAQQPIVLPPQPAPIREAACPNCRKMIRVDSEFCTYCRIPLTINASGSVGKAPQPQSQTPPAPNNVPIRQAQPTPPILPPLNTPASPVQSVSMGAVGDAPCPSCGKVIHPDFEFCAYCGTALSADASERLNTVLRPQPQTPPAPIAVPLDPPDPVEIQKVPPTSQERASELYCPQCKHGVQRGARYCPNCRYELKRKVPDLSLRGTFFLVKTPVVARRVLSQSDESDELELPPQPLSVEGTEEALE